MRTENDYVADMNGNYDNGVLFDRITSHINKIALMKILFYSTTNAAFQLKRLYEQVHYTEMKIETKNKKNANESKNVPFY
jgi:hypothetical protein